MSTTTDGMRIDNAGVGASAAKNLKGGTYAFSAAATFGGGNVQVQALMPDSTTWANVGTSLTAAGLNSFDLPPGQYRFNVTTATAVYAALVGVPK
jgi:hypothetical protein